MMDPKPEPPIWRCEIGDGPLVAAAIHDGHEIRSEVAAIFRLSEKDRLYEEDPYTAGFTQITPTRIIGCRSRFEVDFNRPRASAVYLTPEDAWGLEIWQTPPPQDVVARSLAAYDDFYAHVHFLLSRLVDNHGRVVVFDLHSYNHCRAGRGASPSDPEEHPEINVGTGSLNRQIWAPIVDRVIGELQSYDYLGRHLDVRENVRFFGGEFPRWIHRSFPGTVCAIALEVKKFFMDEWTNELDERQFHAVREALSQAARSVLDELER
jgi:N-formylglutamate amidohydrolase